jgi:hypothetical protein
MRYLSSCVAFRNTPFGSRTTIIRSFNEINTYTTLPIGPVTHYRLSDSLALKHNSTTSEISDVPRKFWGEGGVRQEFFSVGGGGGFNKFSWGQWETEQGSGGVSPLVRGSTQFANEWNPYSDQVVTDVFSTELGIWLSFVKTSEFRGGGPPNPSLYTTVRNDVKQRCTGQLVLNVHRYTKHPLTRRILQVYRKFL